MIAQLNYDYSFLCYVNWKKAKRKLACNMAEPAKVSESGKVLAIRLLKFIRKTFGSSVRYSKKNVHRRDKYTCQYCGSKEGKMTIDHVIPKSKGGKVDCFENTVCCCGSCNTKKADKLPSEAGMFLKRKPVKPTIMEFYLGLSHDFKLDEL